MRGAELRIGILGPLIITRDGAELRTHRPAERTILGLLVLSEGAPVSQESLIDALWPGEPPATATAIVHTYMSRLRNTLNLRTASREARLSHRSSSYRLELAESELDLMVFRRLLAKARATRNSGNADQACEIYEQSLQLWRGEPFEDLATLRGCAAAVTLEQERSAAVLEYAAIASGKGWHARVLPYLRALVSREPLDESAHAQLMIALAGAGRQGEAVDLYEALRLRLDEQLGIYPGSVLQDAHARVLRQDIALPAADPGGSNAVNSAGSEALAQPPIGNSAHLPICQLPPVVTDFTGRAAECETLAGVLDSGDETGGVPVAVVSGAPGMGKTALALRVAHSIRDTFPDGQFYVYLAAHSPSPRTTADALGELLRALGVDGSSVPDSLEGRSGLFRSLTAGRKLLVMLDDVASAEQVRALLPGPAGSGVIVTARSRLGSLAGAHFLSLDPLPEADAAEMLSRIVGRERMDADQAASMRLITACGRLPLALRIAGAKLATRPSWPVDVVTQAVADERRRLDTLVVDDMAVRASISSSYDTLDASGRQAFRRLGLLAASEVAEWVVAALVDQDEAAESARMLVDRSLLMPVGTDGTGEPRYRLHDLLRDYAVERLDDEPEDSKSAAMIRALSGWLQLAAVADSHLPRVPSILRLRSMEPPSLPGRLVQRVVQDPTAWFNAERVNLVAATEQACALGMYELAGELAACQATFQYFNSRLDDAERIWPVVIAATEAAGTATASAYARLRFAAMLNERGKHAEAMEMLSRCLSALMASGDDNAIAIAFFCYAHSAEQHNLLADAKDYAMRGLDVSRRIGDIATELSILRVLGIVTVRQGDPENGTQMCREALALSHKIQDRYLEFETLQTLVYACNLADNHHATIELSHLGIKMAHELGYPVGEGYVLGPLGDAYSALGRYHEAWEALDRAREIFRSAGLIRVHAVCLLRLAAIDRVFGRHEHAVQKLQASLTAFRELQLVNLEQMATDALAEYPDTRSPGT